MGHYSLELGYCQWLWHSPVDCVHPLNMFLLFTGSHPSCFGDIWVVRHGEEAPKRAPDGYQAADNEQPSPTRKTTSTVEASIDGGLQIAAEHTCCVASRVEDGNPFAQLWFHN